MTGSAYSRIWPGILAFVLSLIGTLLLGIAQGRLYGVLLLVGAGVLAVVIWGRVRWPPPFAQGPSAISLPRARLVYLTGIGAIGLVLLGAHVSDQRKQPEPDKMPDEYRRDRKLRNKSVPITA